jgi:hypothetical protein
MNKLFRTLRFAAFAALVPTLAAAQNPQLNLPDFRSLAQHASDSVNISLGPWLLHIAGSLINDKDPEAASEKQLLAGIASIQVRSYEFNSDSAYSAADIETVRRQLDGPGWAPLLQSRNQQEGERVDIYVMRDADHTQGFALIATEPRQVTIINITGSIDLASLPALERRLHVPVVQLPVTETTDPRSVTDESL